jgi:ergothioneine biosynthesis protein EgtB
MQNFYARSADHAWPDLAALRDAFVATRAYTETLVRDLSPEDQCVQSMPDASPAKWHRAHTTWFFETFIAQKFIAGYVAFDRRFPILFNSYYQSVGERHPRPARGLLTRPSAGEVTEYRRFVDAAILQAMEVLPAEALSLIALGVQHEQQHQELLVTDILHAFSQNPLDPACLPGWREPEGAPGPTRIIDFPGGIARIGARESEGFAFDNESPAHRVLLAPHRLASRLVRNAEFSAFIEDGGYGTPSLWMSDGWDFVQAQRVSAPFYWREGGQMTPGGLRDLLPESPVRHISWYEADAFARWAGGRLPTEAELEAANACGEIEELTGHAWQWTGSAYLPYPGFRPASGAVGEYNGKFMVNQMVLRGGSFATPPGHARPSYRNFFPPEKRWQFSGLRLAFD